MTADQTHERNIIRRLDDLAMHLERAKIAEYVDLMQTPTRLIYLNLLAGLSRGLGIALGFGALGALVLYFLRQTLMLNLPAVATVIAELVSIVQRQLGP